MYFRWFKSNMQMDLINSQQTVHKLKLKLFIE